MYVPFNSAVVFTLVDNGGTTKSTVSGVTNAQGYYWLNMHSNALVGDTAVVDVGSLHFEQEIQKDGEDVKATGGTIFFSRNLF